MAFVHDYFSDHYDEQIDINNLRGVGQVISRLSLYLLPTSIYFLAYLLLPKCRSLDATDIQSLQTGFYALAAIGHRLQMMYVAPPWTRKPDDRAAATVRAFLNLTVTVFGTCTFSQVFFVYFKQAPVETVTWAMLLVTVTGIVTWTLTAQVLLHRRPKGITDAENLGGQYLLSSTLFLAFAVATLSRRSAVADNVVAAFSAIFYQIPAAVRTLVGAGWLVYPSLVLRHAKHACPSNWEILLRYPASNGWDRFGGLALATIMFTTGFLLFISPLPELPRAFAAAGILGMVGCLLCWPCTEYRKFRWEKVSWRECGYGDNYSLQILFALYWIWICGFAVYGLLAFGFGD